MAETGSFAEKVKQQADIVRVIGEYVRLKKAGQNFTGLCPFHQEKTPSFSVHPVKQMYYCFGCHEGGDVFKFVMAMEKCEFPEAVRTVAEKCGIPIPRPRERSPEERRENQQRAALIEMHAQAATFFSRQLNDAAEGKVASAYLEDRGLDRAASSRFGLGFAPSSGDALLRQLKTKYSEKLLDVSGLFSRDQSGRLYDRFRRRIMFPIANEAGKIIAFGGRAMGDEQPKYLNSPETLIYSKSNVLYNLHHAKERLRQIREPDLRYMVLVEGYVDCIRVDIAEKLKGKVGVVASCGTSLTEAHIRLIHRLTSQIVVWYDKDSAGQAATDRSLQLLLDKEMHIDVYQYAPGASSDPDSYMRQAGSDSASEPIVAAIDYLAWELEIKELELEHDREMKKIDLQSSSSAERHLRQSEQIQKRDEAKARKPRPPGAAHRMFSYQDFLMARARALFNVTATEGKLGAVNFLMPYVQRIPGAIVRSEWATRIASELRVDEPVLRESLRRAAAERRSEVKPQPELLSSGIRPAERRLMQMLYDAETPMPDGQVLRQKLAHELIASAVHRGLETERIFEVLVTKVGERPDAAKLAAALEERDRQRVFETLFEPYAEATWEEAESCLTVLRNRSMQQELAELQKQIEAKAPPTELTRLLARRLELQKLLARSKGGLSSAS